MPGIEYMQPEESRRYVALCAALGDRDTFGLKDVTAEDIVKRAETFEAYLKGSA